jgi:hypothetical protein
MTPKMQGLRELTDVELNHVHGGNPNSGPGNSNLEPPFNTNIGGGPGGSGGGDKHSDEVGPGKPGGH